MLKILLKNPKRIVRNLTIIFISYLVASAIFVATAFALPYIAPSLNIKPWIMVAVSVIGSIILMFLVIAVLGQIVNKKDAELRRRYKTEIDSLKNSSLAEANGLIDDDKVVNTTRDVAKIKEEVKKLQTELYHAIERDKNLKLAKKF